MEKMLINERFKSPNKEFEKVFNLFRKKDYFDEKSQVKKKQEEFVRFLKKGDPMATKVFKQNKEDMKSSLSFIEDMVMDYNKKNHFEAFQIFSKAVNNVEMKDSKSAENSGKFIKSKIHNNSQKYSLAIYSAIRKQKFNNYKDVHKDVDELISKNEGFSSDAQRKAAFANGYEEKGKKNESVNEAKKTDQWTLDVIDHLEYLKYPKKDIDYIMDFEKKKIKGWKRKKLHPTTVGQQLNIILKKLRRNEAIEPVNEAKVKRPVNRWLELKNDESMHAHKKMAMGLKELKYQLRETEKFFNWYNKIKTMNELDSNQYWKRTNKHIYKIKERLINIARTIQEIEK